MWLLGWLLADGGSIFSMGMLDGRMIHNLEGLAPHPQMYRTIEFLPDVHYIYKTFAHSSLCFLFEVYFLKILLFFFFYVCGCFACIQVHHIHAKPMEAGRGSLIPWNPCCEFTHGYWELNPRWLAIVAGAIDIWAKLVFMFVVAIILCLTYTRQFAQLAIS